MRSIAWIWVFRVACIRCSLWYGVTLPSFVLHFTTSLSVLSLQSLCLFHNAAIRCTVLYKKLTYISFNSLSRARNKTAGFCTINDISFLVFILLFFFPLPKKNGETTKYTNNNNALFGTAVIINTHREKEKKSEWDGKKAKKAKKNEHSYNKNHAILWPASSVLLIWKFLQFRCLHRFLPSNQRRLIEKSRWTSVI